MIRVHLEGPLLRHAPRLRVLARPVEGGHGRRRAHHQHELRRRPPGQHRTERPTPPPRAAIASLTLVQAAELGRYGVTSNAIAPVGAHAHDRGGLRRHEAKPEDGTSTMASRRTSRRWSSGSAARSRASVTGRVFEVQGGKISVADGWRDRTRRTTRARAASAGRDRRERARARSRRRCRRRRSTDADAWISDSARSSRPCVDERAGFSREPFRSRSDVRTAMTTELGYDKALWQQIATELGWPSVTIPEALRRARARLRRPRRPDGDDGRSAALLALLLDGRARREHAPRRRRARRRSRSSCPRSPRAARPRRSPSAEKSGRWDAERDRSDGAAARATDSSSTA